MKLPSHFMIRHEGAFQVRQLREFDRGEVIRLMGKDGKVKVITMADLEKLVANGGDWIQI